MSVDHNTRFKTLDAKLHKLVACVLKKAKADAAFAAELSHVLIDGSANSVEQQNASKPALPPSFDSVSFLHEHGEDGLRKELGLKPDSDLRAIMKYEGLVKTKEAKTFERDRMISEIVNYASRKLKQGSAFLGKI